jgi:trigger factor
MTLTIAADQVAEAIDEVAGMFRQRAKMQGFRRGKAPMAMIRQRFAEEIRENVLDQLIPLHVGHEIKARGLKPLHNPMLEKVDFEPGTPLLVELYFDVRPEVAVTGYNDLTATKTVRPVSEDAVEKAVADMREQAAKLESIDEDGIEEGDYVVVRIELFPREGKGKKLAEEERFVHVGEERSIPALNTQLVGHKRGAQREFVTELGESFPNDLLAGKEVLCRLQVREIKRRRLPPVDDDMARDLGFADLAELRARTRDNYARHLEEEAQRDVARQLMDRIIAANRVDTPESLVDARLDHSMQRAAQDLARQGIDPRHSVDWGAYRAENRTHAERAVTEEILLDAIADAEGLAVQDADVLAEIERHQEGQPQGTAQRIAQQMRQDDSFEGLRRAMLRRRALDFVKSHATIDSVESSPDPEVA